MRHDWREVYAVHPSAAIFPAMDAADLQTLADDIRLHGLRERVKLWREIADSQGLESEDVSQCQPEYMKAFKNTPDSCRNYRPLKERFVG